MIWVAVSWQTPLKEVNLLKILIHGKEALHRTEQQNLGGNCISPQLQKWSLVLLFVLIESSKTADIQVRITPGVSGAD